MTEPAASAPVPRKRRVSRFAAWRERIADRLARSSRVFLLGLLVACGVEVLVDWNSTLFEINVLRDGMRQRGQNYARILANAGVVPMLSYDAAALEQLVEGVFHDEDVVLVRFADDRGTVLLDRMRPAYAARFHKRRGVPFREYFGTQLRRDVGGILSDPEGLAQRMASSRHRDFVQAWNDLMARVIARFVGPQPPVPRQGPLVLYQDRLKQRGGGHEPDVTYALCTITDERGEDLGVVVVAFSMDRVNSAITKKYLKGLGIVVFFIGVILIQNLVSRRDKLRLLELEERQKLAKQALRDALPAATGDTAVFGPLAVTATLMQAEGPVDGLAWDVLGPEDAGAAGEVILLVVDPDGEGASAVATSLHVLRTLRRRRAAGPITDLLGEAAALGEAAMTLPLTRPLHLWLVRIELATGAIAGVCTATGGARVLHALGDKQRQATPPSALDETPLLDAEQTPVGLVGPLSSLRGELPPGGVLCGLFAGVGQRRERRAPDADAVAEHLRRSRRAARDLGAVASEATRWARGHLPQIAKGDVLVLLAARSEKV